MPGHTENEIDAALKRPPKDLEELYQKIFANINNQPPECRKMALTIFRWLTCAKRPLTVSEIVHISAIKDGLSAVDPPDIPWRQSQVVLVCGNLVKINSQPNVVEFIHSSVKDILMQRGPITVELGEYILGSEADVHRTIAEDCLVYMSLVFQPSANNIASSLKSSAVSSVFSASMYSSKDNASSATRQSSFEIYQDLADLVLEDLKDIRPDLLEYAVKFWSWHVSNAKIRLILEAFQCTSVSFSSPRHLIAGLIPLRGSTKVNIIIPEDYLCGI